ncbi:ACT domain-containing protein [Xylariomycetidae sp. FL2044]|nr:ACT domain-containing protein [Xylariomycetidae sp. FL2044]
MNASITFLEGTFSLIHIPLDLYSSFLQPIVQVLLPQDEETTDDLLADDVAGLSIDNKHGFLNISITPVECSVVCHTEWARRVFEPVVRKLPTDVSKTVTISNDSYLILSVISTGMNAGNQVMELTSPLALAGIPIFFITTYYSDFILVPARDRQTVVQALLARGFEFLEDESAYVSPSAMTHARGMSQSSEPPSTPPPSTVAELQARTFDLLKKRHVVPYISPGLRLAQCSGRDTSNLAVDYYSPRPALSRQGTGGGGRQNGDYYGYNGDSGGGTQHRQSWLDNVDTKLYTSLMSVLAAQPRFLSITLAQEDGPSLLVDKSLLRSFGDALVGDTDRDLVPIFLDLHNLPLEATGIVSGVAGTLVEKMRMTDDNSSSSDAIASELSYLSTARAGAVILSEESSLKALEVLGPLLE